MSLFETSPLPGAPYFLGAFFALFACLNVYDLPPYHDEPDGGGADRFGGSWWKRAAGAAGVGREAGNTGGSRSQLSAAVLALEEEEEADPLIHNDKISL